MLVQADSLRKRAGFRTLCEGFFQAPLVVNPVSFGSCRETVCRVLWSLGIDMSELRAQGLWSQLRGRKVFRVAITYVIVGWVLMQIGEVAFESLGVPPWALTLLIVLVLLGFPLALLLAWAYELTPHGIRKDPAGYIESTTQVDHYQDGAPSVAVLPFDDMSPKSDQAYFCEGIAEEILNAL